MMLEFTMMGPQSQTPVEAGMQMARGMRVVVFDQDATVLARVRDAIHDDHGFVLAGESQRWRECQALLDCFVPELLIASVAQIPGKFLEQLSQAEFPVLVGLREDGVAGCGPRHSLFDMLEVPPEEQQVRSLLWRVRREIYRRKADGLSVLLQQYVACAGKSEHYLSHLMIEDQGQSSEVAVDDVLFFAADGNYVKVHTQSRTYEIRDTLTGIASKLDPSRFARVHRSFIVNLSYVRDVIAKDGFSVSVRLDDGVELPVGPNYRQDLDSVLRARHRLSA